jgi:hypothetical protein
MQINISAPRKGYSIFDSGVYRILAVKWLFPQEKATFDALVMSTSEAKMLYCVVPMSCSGKECEASSGNSRLIAG